jgi:hypothetical protein
MHLGARMTDTDNQGHGAAARGGRKLTAREAIARSYPPWDHAMADRLIAWLDHCGYEIVEKSGPKQESAEPKPRALTTRPAQAGG